MAAKKRNRKGPSWAVIVLLLIVLWPVGLYLLYRRLSVPPIGRGGSVAFFVLGLLLLCVPVSFLVLVIVNEGPEILSPFLGGAVAPAAGITGLFCLAAAWLLYRKGRDYRLYTPFLFGHVTTSLDRVAEALNRDYLRVCRELQRLINAGCLQSAYIDYTHRLFVFSRQWLSSPPPPPAAEPEPSGEPEPDNSEAAAFLAEIRRLAETVRNAPLSNRIYQIEGLANKIFQVVESSPEKQSQIRSFMQYYLPATLRLLQTYSELEAQRIRGDNIDEAMRRVEDAAATLADAFKKQLDRLFAGEALDVAAEIQVLQTMLIRDGLAGDQPFSASPPPADSP